jgi:cell division septal protein FtsQ
MKLRRRRSLMSRLERRDRLESSEPLKGQLWTRSERALREPDVHPAWRALAGLAAAVEVGLLVWLWFGPALAVQTVQVTGAHHMTTAQIERAAGVSGGASIISVDGESGSQKLLSQTWIRTATVEPIMPGVVKIQVSEWQPVAAYHAGPSKKLFWLSSQGVVLGGTPNDAGLLDIQGPAGADPRPGDRPLDPDLVTALVNIQRVFPNLIGQEVGSFTFDSCGELTLVSKRGWKVYFGRVLTPEEFSSLSDKLTALKAIAGNGNVNYSSTDLEYVNVMNASEPAVQYRSREPASPSPTPGATPQPTPTPLCK